MPSRPSLLLRSIALRPQPPSWICHTCLRRTIAHPPRRIQRSQQQTSGFHTTPSRYADHLLNYYEILHVKHTATSAEIKRQFYTLSKKNHPDHNQNDAEASTRFVAISEAYHVLSVPEKRAQYDAELEHSHQHSRRGRHGSDHHHPHGSYSSAAYGARPASGLNKKRSTFRGPPPSFYKSGGYGRHHAKRTEHAHSHAHEGGEAGKEAGHESYGEWGGFGPGQQKQGNQVPHFDDRRHKETHDSINEHIWARRRKLRPTVKVEEEWQKGNMLVNFAMVSSVIATIGITAKVFGDRHEAPNKRKQNA
ncbi:DnaJ-domain-containing protein [Decorospora gaudefroyi]|uniref:DnaJ-domain-containing protein n=1 Tax=Decorospora gaudefroyi TaxID=184978 RepID=A0A6A5KL78_9PLEO|nr:DnaJ-domain-containing protein [Decorospora gaudefroyi]